MLDVRPFLDFGATIQAEPKKYRTEGADYDASDLPRTAPSRDSGRDEGHDNDKRPGNAAAAGNCAVAAGLGGGAARAPRSAQPTLVVGLVRQLQSTPQKAAAASRRLALSLARLVRRAFAGGVDRHLA